MNMEKESESKKFELLKTKIDNDLKMRQARLDFEREKWQAKMEPLNWLVASTKLGITRLTIVITVVIIVLFLNSFHAQIVQFFKPKDPSKDPSQNTQPTILEFSFKPDHNLPNIGAGSLKFKPGKAYALHLQYVDREFSESDARKLQAIFSLESGSGKISNNQFGKPRADGIAFNEMPGKFNGDLLFTPDSAGKVCVQLQLFDGMKLSEIRQASVTFFENLMPNSSFTVRLRTQTNPYEVEFDPSRSEDIDGIIAKYIWTFGDNSKPEVVLNNSVITHKYLEAGQYRVRLRVIDNEGQVDSTEQFVTTANQPPQAALWITPTSGKVPLEINYTTIGSLDPDGVISSYQVLCGGGTVPKTTVVGKHTYKYDGNYPVILIVKDNLGLSDTTIVPVRVSTPPTAILKITPEDGGPTPLRLIISGKDSRDLHPGGSITAYRITITNDSTFKQLIFPQDSVTTLLKKPANYLVSLEVTNNRGLTSRVEKVVQVGMQ